MKAWKVFIVAILIISVLALVGLFYAGKTDKTADVAKTDSTSGGAVAGTTSEKNNDYLDNLTTTMSDKGMVLYCSYLSADCKAQKAIFDDSYKNVTSVECDAEGPDANADECIGRNVNIYPTWIYEGQSYEGVQSLANLAKIINFSK